MQHNGRLHLPLRVKAFAVPPDDMASIQEWLPQELRAEPASASSRRAALELKGTSVVSYVFQTGTGMVRCRCQCRVCYACLCASQTRARARDNSLVNSLQSSCESAGAFASCLRAPQSCACLQMNFVRPTHLPQAHGSVQFPEKPPKAAAPPLPCGASIRSQPDDPDMAALVKLGNIANTMMAEYRFKALEFAKPTRMVRS